MHSGKRSVLSIFLAGAPFALLGDISRVDGGGKVRVLEAVRLKDGLAKR